MTKDNVVLYHGLASTCSKKVRLSLYEKGIPFESKLLDLQKFEQHDSEYLKLNPNGVVPTLVHNGQPIIESSLIIEYIEDAFDGPLLQAKDAFTRYKVAYWLKYSDDVAYKAVYAPTWHALKDRASAQLSQEQQDATLSRVPTRERRDRWKKMADGGYSEDELADAYEKMNACLDYAEKSLEKDGPWLAGEHYTLADIAMIPFIDRIKNLRPEFMESDQYPALNEWYERMSKREAFQKAFNFVDDPRYAELPNF
ncbi:Glutathione S-transferase BbdE (plasmid) [Aminobacter sp. MSH1]|uniref:glutathione S-transferase family protein n=1 Tax=Aminobacter sp. MSH1 TaxID=374606 RepID=UPI0009DC55FC|nr:glutathione S-transferase family protein [Aminobacter sp. MSH1]ARD70012.1 Glutathione S-transferase BbdE [Aminobacter sp. MSH1]